MFELDFGYGIPGIGRFRFDVHVRCGGVIAPCEFGIGARPENVAAVFDNWNR